MKRMLLFLVFFLLSSGVVFAQNSAGGFTYAGGENLASASVSTIDFGGLTVTRFNFVPSAPITVNPAARWDINLSSPAGVSKILLEGTSPVGSRVVKIAVAINGGQAVGTQRISTSPGSALGTFEFVMNPSGVVMSSLNVFVAYENSQQNPNATENTFLLRSITFQDAGGNNTVVYTSPGGGGGTVPVTPTLGLPNEGTAITLPYTFTWGSVADATSYTFQIDTDQNFTDPISINETVTVTSYTVSSLPAGTYYWRVRANGTGGSSSFSSARSVTVNTATPPSPPTLVSPTNSATDVTVPVSFSWGAVSGGTFRIQIMTMAGAIVIDQSGLSGSSAQISGLQNNTQYQWRMTVTTLTGTSDWSPTFTFTTASGVVIPTIPTLVSPTNGATNQPTSLILDWSDVTNATSYRIQVMLMSGTVVTDQTVTTGSQYTVSGLQNGTSYQWRVNASNSAGTSDWSPTWTFTTATGVQVPGNVILISPLNNSTGADFGSVTLVWTKGSNSPESEFQVDKNSTFSSPVFSGTVSGIEATIQNLDPGTTYYWRVRGKNGTVYGSWSSIWNFMTEGVTSVEDNSIPNEFKLEQNYPNPFNPATSIKYKVASITNVKLAVYDILGREVATLVDEIKPPGTYEVSFDASRLSAGMYVYTIQAGKFSETRKMLLLK